MDRLCSSYPEILFIPTSMTNNIIYGSSKFRSKQRFPVLSYYHDSSKAAICRSSQPLAGLTKKCKEDILLLQAIAKSSHNSPQLVIVDTRPKINALANKAKGKGFEDTKNYPFCKFYFSGIENIHVMRESRQKLFQAIYSNHDSYISFMNAVDNSGWMKHIKAILDAAIFVSQTILCGTNVLVHCSDGWDRTSQTCALASLFLDPFYRTIHGFIILIEKDFLSFGHRFSTRCQHLAGDNKNVAPIFLQFLDCVWQVLRQFPASFQFNELFLIYISKNVYSCEYGTFLYNSVSERKKNKYFK
ncbi:phosphatidylinositol-3-phosphate phosphatase MTMR7-like [Pempheris klunzingeri]|uniref:phosphatidylinositol-3-phosphate phosphatase MTMR7-like n=1 Tax=Pempheris klunzingeri TaxID=3127111 RepID=UPI00397F6DBA